VSSDFDDKVFAVVDDVAVTTTSKIDSAELSTVDDATRDDSTVDDAECDIVVLPHTDVQQRVSDASAAIAVVTVCDDAEDDATVDDAMDGARDDDHDHEGDDDDDDDASLSSQTDAAKLAAAAVVSDFDSPAKAPLQYDDDSDVVIDEPEENAHALPKKRRAAVKASAATRFLATVPTAFMVAQGASGDSNGSSARARRLAPKVSTGADKASSSSTTNNTTTAAASSSSSSKRSVKKASLIRQYQKQVGFSVGCKLTDCLVCNNGVPPDLDRKPPPANLIEVAMFALLCDLSGIDAILSGVVNPLETPDDERVWFTFEQIRDFLHHHWASLKQSTLAEENVLGGSFLADVARTDRRFRVQEDRVTLLVPRNVYEANVFASSPEAAPTAEMMDTECVLCGQQGRGNGHWMMVRRPANYTKPKPKGRKSSVAEPQPQPQPQEEQQAPLAVEAQLEGAAAAAAAPEMLMGDWAHNLCLYYASRLPSEDDTKMVARAKSHKLKCTACKEPRATIGCCEKTCKRIYHQQCAKLNGEWHDGERAFYCSLHTPLAVQKVSELTRFPHDSGIEYRRVCDWSNIAPEDIAKIDAYRYCWQAFGAMWFAQNLESPLKVLPIGPGHWAYSGYLNNNYLHGHPVQYEVVASRDIEADEFLGEYVGTVCYQDGPNSEYVAALYWPDGLPAELANRQLVIDAADIGNETRYINSVNDETAHFIQRNATMNTVWCNGRLRVLITATRNVPKGHPIVLDYEEHGGSFFDTDDEDDAAPHQPPAAAAAQEIEPFAVDPNADVVVAESSELFPHVAAESSEQPPPQPLAASGGGGNGESLVVAPEFDVQIYNQGMREECESGFCVALDAVDVFNRPIMDENVIEDMRCGHYELLIARMYAQEWRGGDPVYVAQNKFKPLVAPASKKKRRKRQGE
jgi:hypothetical protein